MTHRRTQIRSAFVARLAQDLTPPPAEGQEPEAPAYRTIAEERVYTGRLMPVEEPDLPAIVVHTREPERILQHSPSGWNGFQRRECVVSVICVAQSFEDIDADLDTLTAQVEAALEAWDIPDMEGAEIRQQDTASDDPEFAGSLSTGASRLRYAVSYIVPWRDCSDPYVQDEPESIYRSGAYPGGQVTPGCPATNTGDACPTGEAELFSQEEPIN